MTVAILGCGRIGRVHAEAVRRIAPDVRLVVADGDQEAAKAMGETFKAAAVHADHATLLAREHPAIVHVCTPPETHAALAVAALEAGAAVLVEKPMALDGAEAARVAAALDERPGALCVDHNYLFEPEMLLARRWIGEGHIGRVLGADVVQGVDGAGAAWAAGLPGGRLTDLLPHGLYLVRHCVGEARGVSAFASAATAGGPATELRVLVEGDRALGAVYVTLAAAPWELSLTVRGTTGRVHVDFARQEAILVPAYADGNRHVARVRRGLMVGMQRTAGTLQRFAGKASGRLRGYPGLRTLVARFHASVRDGLPPPVAFRDGAAVAVLLERVRQRVDERGTRRPERLVARRRSA